MSKKLDSQYVKDVEKHNSDLDTKNMHLSADNEKMIRKIKNLQGAHDDFSACLNILLERYGSDPDIKREIMSTLEKVSKNIVSGKYLEKVKVAI